MRPARPSLPNDQTDAAIAVPLAATLSAATAAATDTTSKFTALLPAAPKPAASRPTAPLPTAPKLDAPKPAVRQPTAPNSAASTPAAPKSGPQRAMEKLGLRRPIDLALHLPMRYEDETRLTPIAALRDGVVAQIDGIVSDSRIELRGRRQLIVRVRAERPERPEHRVRPLRPEHAEHDKDAKDAKDDDHGANDADADAGPALTLRFLHFYPSQQKALAVGRRVRARGEARVGFFGLEMVHPSVKCIEKGAPLPRTLTPVYPTSAQLPQAWLRKAVAAGLARADLREVLPTEAVPPGLMTLHQALHALHQPAADTPVAALEDRSHPAWQRLKFEELLAQQLSQLQAKREREAQRGPAFKVRAHGLRHALLAALPFALTPAQRRVADEIAADLQRSVPMHRLLQGDVGSGKTVVAALAAAVAIEDGWQCALMAPTEILAEQHFAKLVDWLAPLGITVAWLTGSRKGKARAAMLEQVRSGAAALVVGTHAVIQEQVEFKRLGLAIIDEQHRFGVQQRLALRGKLAGWDDGGAPLEACSAGSAAAAGRSAPSAPSGPSAPSAGSAGSAPAAAAAPPLADKSHSGSSAVASARLAVASIDTATTAPPSQPSSPPVPSPLAPLAPHLLMMSATPIPRTLAMTLFADLDISTIDALPPGRTPIVTKLFSEAKRDAVVDRIREAVGDGRQVYWVCPLIEESETLDLKDATATHEQLRAALPEHAVGLLHGRMPAAAKAAVMAQFSAGGLAVLVATTVIEVGVDVPNASLMVVEHAERFGLSQLHQLRGRVGRGTAASVCVLLYATPLSPQAKARLKAMLDTQDGFEIARQDLAIRGPGEFLGARQSGAPMLRFADLELDQALVAAAQRAAALLLARHPQAAARHVARWLGAGADYLKA